MSRNPTTDAARRTRDRVLSTALELFNEGGTASVSTNHVAAAAEISPGNLYYWFADKDEIVRELYARFVAAYQVLWGAGDKDPDKNPDKKRGERPGEHPGEDLAEDLDEDLDEDPLGLTPGEVLARFAEGAALSRRYAFLTRDLLALLHADPVLAAQYGAVRTRRTAEFTALAHAWRTRGVIRAVDDETVADLVQALWIVAESWVAFAEIDGARADAEQGARLLRLVLGPYLTPARDSSGQ